MKLFPIKHITSSKTSTHWLIVALVFVLSLVTTLLRFKEWMPTTLSGDDLALMTWHMNEDYANKFAQGWTRTYSERFRPVHTSLMFLFFKFFAFDYAKFLTFNVVLHAFNATLVYLIACKLTNGIKVIAVIAAIFAAASRFGLYQVTQMSGNVEGLALMFFLATVYFSTFIIQSAKPLTHLSLATCFAMLAIFTHERYIVVLPWITVVAWITPFTLRVKILITIVCSFCGLLNVALKKYLFNVLFLNGSGKPFDLNFDRIMSHLKQVSLSIFGFNHGPEYLSGIQLINASTQMKLTAFIATAFLVLSLIWFSYDLIKYRGSRNRFTLSSFYLLILLACFILTPPVLTTHIEQRWLLGPYILLLLMCCLMARHLLMQNNLQKFIVALMFCGLTLHLYIDSKVVKHYEHIFFISSNKFARSVKTEIIDSNQNLFENIGFIAHPIHCQWSLYKGNFFRFYADSVPKIYCFNDISEFIDIDDSVPIFIYKTNETPSLSRVFIEKK